MNDRKALYGCLTFVAVASASGAAAETRVGADVTVDGGYASNPFLQTVDNAGTALVRTTIQPKISLLDATSELSLTGLLSRTEYSRLYDGQTDYGATGNFSKALSAVSRFNLQASFSSRIQNGLINVDNSTPGLPDEDPSEFESSGRRVKNFSGSAGFTTATSARGSLSLEGFATHVSSAGTVGSGNNYDRYGGTVGYNHAVDARLSLGFSGSFSRNDYVDELLGHSSLFVPSVTAAYRITPRIRMSAVVGATLSDIKQAGVSFKQTSFSGSFDLCHDGDRLTLCASAGRSIRPTANTGVSTVTNLSVNANYELSPRSSVGGELGYGETRNLRGDLLPGRNRDLATRSASAYYSRDLSRRLTLDVRASYRDPFKSTVDRDANFTAKVGVTYRLGRTR